MTSHRGKTFYITGQPSDDRIPAPITPLQIREGDTLGRVILKDTRRLPSSRSRGEHVLRPILVGLLESYAIWIKEPYVNLEMRLITRGGRGRIRHNFVSEEVFWIVMSFRS